MNIKNKLIKLADLFDKAGEGKIADHLDQTLDKVLSNDSGDDDLIILEEKLSFTSNELNIIRAFLNMLFVEIEEEFDIDTVNKLETMIIDFLDKRTE